MKLCITGENFQGASYVKNLEVAGDSIKLHKEKIQGLYSNLIQKA
jgi:hypothetical protein